VNRVVVRFNDEELARIEEAAQALRVTRSFFMRRTAMLDAWKVLKSTQIQKDHQGAARLYSS
jgi:uncharacterized protein (DUF1778 family)